MTRVVFAFVLILGAFFVVLGQEAIDLVLLLDTSSSMSSSYREVNNYMTGGFLKEFLRIGDTFHLIPFSDAARVDISRRVEGRGDVETIIGRMLLQYPLETGSDISAALSYAEKYVSTLPSRPKKIILITDGNTVSVPGGSAGTSDPAGLQNLIAETKTRLGRQGIVLEYVKVPLTALPSSGRTPQAPISTGTAAGRQPSQPAEPSRPPVPQTQTPAPAPARAQPQSPAVETPQQRQPPTDQTSGAGTSRPAPSEQSAPSGQAAPAKGTESGIPGSPAASGSPDATGTLSGKPEDSGSVSAGSVPVGSVPAGTPSPQERSEPSDPPAGTEGALSGPEQTGRSSGEPQPSRTGQIPGTDTVSPAQVSPAPVPARQ
ncbi:MAG: VWA domain-containing protein, partial [Treponema sp.]|nr:VWA domain-containing protein [Treponema sp.]